MAAISLIYDSPAAADPWVVEFLFRGEEDTRANVENVLKTRIIIRPIDKNRASSPNYARTRVAFPPPQPTSV